MRLKHKVIIITGSCTGIGKAIAIRCVAEGAKVVIHGLEKAWGEEVVSALGKENAVLYIEDIINEGAPQRLVDVAVNTYGKLDAIVNNAAVVPSSNIHTTDLALLRRTIEINTVAPFALIKAALPHLSKQRGCVLNIGSVNAFSGEPNLLAYSMSKGALMTMTQNLGDTLFREEGVRVNQINPGWVLTENETIRKRQHGLEDDWYKDLPNVYAPAGRIIWPKEIAAAAVYWLSDESGPISGQYVTLEQYPVIGRNPPKDTTTIPGHGRE
ncbi:MAG: SDR family oxidoreductase [Chitinophagaceae bacterium]|nr:SDR family oxidoreductase [Chitinophagaceae bacterium]